MGEEMGRREFLARLAGGAAVATAPAVVDSYTDEDVKLERDGNVSHIERPEGTYTFVFEDHLTTTNPDDVPTGIDGLFLESGVENYVNQPEKSIEYFRDGIDQYGEIIPQAEREGTPIYLTDVHMNPSVLGEAVLLGVEGIAGMRIMKNEISSIREESALHSFSRRQTLAHMGKGTLAVWLMLPGITRLLTTTARVTDSNDEVSTLLSRMEKGQHPEIGVAVENARNTAIGYKEQWLMEQEDDNPHYATVIGALHVGLEEVMESSQEEKLSYLEATRPYWEKFVGDEESLYTAIKLEYDDVFDEWEVEERYEIPELKQLVDGN